MQEKKDSFWSISAKSLLFALITAFALGYFIGYKPILVYGWSAEPYIQYKSLIIIKKTDLQDLKVGDFVTFSKTGNSYVTHQIISIDGDQIVCRGWNYDRDLGEYRYQDDIQVLTYQNIVGKVVFSNFLIGNTAYTLRSNKILLFGVLGLAVLAFLAKDSFKTKSPYA